MTRRFLILGAIFFLCPLPALAATDYTCPEDLKADQSVSRIPHGWLSSTLTTDIPKSDTLIVFDGPPGEMASLVPDNEGSSGAAYWSFPAEKERPVWVQCGYAGLATYFMRPLPENIVKCTQTQETTLSCE